MEGQPNCWCRIREFNVLRFIALWWDGPVWVGGLAIRSPHNSSANILDTCPCPSPPPSPCLPCLPPHVSDGLVPDPVWTYRVRKLPELVQGVLFSISCNSPQKSDESSGTLSPATSPRTGPSPPPPPGTSPSAAPSPHPLPAPPTTVPIHGFTTPLLGPSPCGPDGRAGGIVGPLPPPLLLPGPCGPLASAGGGASYEPSAEVTLHHAKRCYELSQYPQALELFSRLQTDAFSVEAEHWCALCNGGLVRAPVETLHRGFCLNRETVTRRPAPPPPRPQPRVCQKIRQGRA